MMKTVKLRWLCGIAVLFGLISACSTQYYGYTKAQWQNMTPFEREKAKVEYRDIIEAKEKGALGDPRAEIIEGFVDYSESINNLWESHSESL